MTDKNLRPDLWTERSIADTQDLYTDWAARYDADLGARGYHTPTRLAEALAPFLSADDERPILDFGCGTGLSGLALRAAGLGPLHGTDITPAMIDEAESKAIYDRLWVSQPGALDAEPGRYRAITAIGVISLGAAPPETLDLVVAALGAGDLLALSFNDPTRAHGGYDAQLNTHLEAGRLSTLARQHGPHLDESGMGSDVIILRAT